LREALQLRQTQLKHGMRMASRCPDQIKARMSAAMRSVVGGSFIFMKKK
jgi:hypothetical protein